MKTFVVEVFDSSDKFTFHSETIQALNYQNALEIAGKKWGDLVRSVYLISNK